MRTPRRRRFRPACICGSWPWGSRSASSTSAAPPTLPRLGRTHQTMTLQAFLGQRRPDQTPLWAGLDARRAMLNEHIPSCALQGRAPLQAYPRAKPSGRSYSPEWEAEMLDLARAFAYLANCRWFRRIRANGRLDLGGYDSYFGTTYRNRMLELHFDANQGCFLGQPAGSDTAITFAPQGLTKIELMGELGHLLALPIYQLALPFTHEAWRHVIYRMKKSVFQITCHAVKRPQRISSLI